MMLQENVSLKPYHTFHTNTYARYFAQFSDVKQLATIFDLYRGKNSIILGGGSNILFTGDYDGLILRNEIKGIKKVDEDDNFVYVRAGGGENWHQFVLHCISNNYGGIENLSLIPGNVGASPMQNIGAYGVEIKDVFHELDAWHLQDEAMVSFYLDDCKFGYRESVFKNIYKKQFVITSVTFRLRKKPLINTTYGAINQELEKSGITEPTIKDVSDAVIRIRSSKLPDPEKIGNAGSFFKNPSISAEKYDMLKKQFPDIVGYKNTDGSIKLAAGWLIEQCGWKGFRKGDAGCHAFQALVLVNYGNATGREIVDLSSDILESVHKRFDVLLEREVNII